MMNRLAGKDHMNVEMKDPLHVYYNKVCASLIMDFAQLCNNGMRIEDSSDSGIIEKNEGRMFAPTKKVLEVQENLLMSKLTLILFIQINTRA